MQLNFKILWEKIIVFNRLFLIVHHFNLNKINNGTKYKEIKLLELKMGPYVDSNSILVISIRFFRKT